MGWKKFLIGGTLVVTGSFTMFEYLILDKTVLRELGSDDATYVGYLSMYGKNYKTIEEYKYRKPLFFENVEEIKQHSQSLINGNKIGTYIMGLNHMSDWSQ